MLDIGSRLELFVDTFLIEEMRGVDLMLHPPIPRELSLIHDAPWEGNSTGNHTVFKDEGIYKMYYLGYVQTLKGETAPHPLFPCYAESQDGIHWQKPDLGLVEFQGSRRNNLVDIPADLPLFPFRDTNPDAKSEGKYKSPVHKRSKEGEQGYAIFGFQSADGLRWNQMYNKPLLTRGVFDSPNRIFWDDLCGTYRAYWRHWRIRKTDKEARMLDPNSVRDIMTATSEDLVHWTEPTWLSYPGAPDEHLYTNQVIPYYRAPHIYLGFPTRYIDRGWSDSMRALPELKHREMRSEASAHEGGREGTALTEGLFMSSRDGRTFKRWLEAFIRPGLQTRSNWAYGDHYQAGGIIETTSTLEDAPNELSLFVTEAGWMPWGSRLRRFAMRIDGFVSVHASAIGGELTTKPFIFNGRELALNFSTSVAGNIKAEVQDANGAPFAGFSMDDCQDIFGDDLERKVTWKGGADVSRLSGKPVRLRFALKDADLYSMRFRA